MSTSSLHARAMHEKQFQELLKSEGAYKRIKMIKESEPQYLNLTAKKHTSEHLAKYSAPRGMAKSVTYGRNMFAGGSGQHHNSRGSMHQSSASQSSSPVRATGGPYGKGNYGGVYGPGKQGFCKGGQSQYSYDKSQITNESQISLTDGSEVGGGGQGFSSKGGGKNRGRQVGGKGGGAGDRMSQTMPALPRIDHNSAMQQPDSSPSDTSSPKQGGSYERFLPKDVTFQDDVIPKHGNTTGGFFSSTLNHVTFSARRKKECALFQRDIV